jgi:ABC-type cobalt transport system substrate-binding protein
MKRKHIVFFTIVTLVCVVALIIFQLAGDGGYFGGSGQKAIDGPGPVAPVGAPAE